MVNGFAQSVAHLPGDPSFAARDLSSIRRGNLWPILPPDVAPADPELRHSMLGMTEAGSVCLLGDAIGDLPEREQLVLSLYYEQELNLREIGAVLGVSESRVCQIHGQATVRLRARLGEWRGAQDED